MSIFWCTPQNLRMTWFCMTDRHPFKTHLCFVHLHLFFFFSFFPHKLSRSTAVFSFQNKTTPQLLFPSAVVAVSLAFWLSALLAWPVAFFCPLPYIYVNSGTLYFNQKEKTTKTKKTIWKPWHSFANFLGELYRFKGTLVFFKNLTVLLSMCISKCLVYFFFSCMTS